MHVTEEEKCFCWCIYQKISTHYIHSILMLIVQLRQSGESTQLTAPGVKIVPIFRAHHVMFLKSCDVHEKSNGSWHAVKFNVIACLEIFFGFSTSIYRRVGALHYTAHFKNMEKLNNILPNMYQWVYTQPMSKCILPLIFARFWFYPYG